MFRHLVLIFGFCLTLGLVGRAQAQTFTPQQRQQIQQQIVVYQQYISRYGNDSRLSGVISQMRAWIASAQRALGQTSTQPTQPQVRYDSVFGFSIPTTFRGDGASVPMLRGYMGDAAGRVKAYLDSTYPSAFRLHDYLYDGQSTRDYSNVTRSQADGILFQHLRSLGASESVALTVYYAVRVGGESHWRR